MSKLLCLKCGEIYDKDLISLTPNEYSFCPKSSCIGEVIEVDDMILHAIKILNDKGYITKYCCSGHAENKPPNGYIMFEDFINLESCPERFKFEDRYGSTIIRSTFESVDYYVDSQNIFKDMIVLLGWANDLDYYAEDMEE